MTDAPVEAPRTSRGKAGYIAIAVTLICGFEGLYLHAYHDVVGVKTICYGHIEDVQMGDVATKAECQEMLADDIPRYEAMVAKAIHVPMPPHRHAAILSFTYNVGGGALAKSSVARKLNAGDVRGGCDALLLYDRAGGRVVRGLHNRRVAERKECLRSD
jgi:lysozyme